MNTIANRLKQALEMRNMKQADLVNMTGIGKSSISTYLSGDYEPKQKNLYRLAKALDVNEAWLMGYDVPMERTSDPSSSQASTETKTSSAVEDPEIRRIERARKSMTEKERERMMNILKASFEEYFSDDFQDEDQDE